MALINTRLSRTTLPIKKKTTKTEFLGYNGKGKNRNIIANKIIRYGFHKYKMKYQDFILPCKFYLNRNFNIYREYIKHKNSILINALEKYKPYNIPNLANVQRECGLIGTSKSYHEVNTSFKVYRNYFYFKPRIKYYYVSPYYDFNPIENTYVSINGTSKCKTYSSFKRIKRQKQKGITFIKHIDNTTKYIPTFFGSVKYLSENTESLSKNNISFSRRGRIYHKNKQ